MAKPGHFLLFLFFFWFFGCTLAQSGENAPAVYDQFFNNYHIVNPANHSGEEKFALRFGNRTLTGLFQGVNRFYADADLSIFNKTDTQKHSIGFFAINNRDGDYFQRNRFYGRYGIQTRLTNLASLSAGISLGMVNYSFGSSVASAGGSSAAPDANLGIWYLREKWKIGVSSQQIFSPSIRPLAQTFILNRYLNLNGIFRIDFSPNVLLNTHVYFKLETQMPGYGELAPILNLRQWLEIGINYRHGRGIALILGFPEIPIGDGKIYIMASYLISTRKLSGQNDSVLEFSLGYVLNKSN